jgi:hypothetical protein
MKKEIIVICNFREMIKSSFVDSIYRVTPITIKPANRASHNSVSVRVLRLLGYSIDCTNINTKYKATFSNRPFKNSRKGILSFVEDYGYSQLEIQLTDGLEYSTDFICGRYLNRIFGKKMKEGNVIYFSFEELVKSK